MPLSRAGSEQQSTFYLKDVVAGLTVTTHDIYLN